MLRLYQCMLVKNRWYKSGIVTAMTHIVVHSSGANNPTLKRYIQPAIRQTKGMAQLFPEQRSMNYYQMLSLLGTNEYANDWNRASQKYGMHAWIGKDANGEVAAVQTLPWASYLWGCGTGVNGSYNTAAIQFEISEDTTDAAYTKAAYRQAVELCAYLCKEFDIPVENIVSHKEAGASGWGDRHVDPEHWWSLYGYTMTGFRRDVQELISGEEVDPVRYQTVEQLPEWAKATVQKLLDQGILQGTGTGLDLSADMVRMLVILDRAGNFD